MKKYMLFISIFALIIPAGCGDDDNGPSGPTSGNDEDYFPLSVGNEWNYKRDGIMELAQVQIGTISGVETLIVTGTENHSGGFEVYVFDNSVTDTIIMYGQTVYSDSICITYVRVTDDGYYGYPHLTDTDSSWVVPFPLAAGNTWQFSAEPPFTGEILSMNEDVSVTAGSFEDCMEMQIVWSEAGMTHTNTTDFAYNVGKVYNIFVNFANNMTITLYQELTSYTIVD